MRGLVRRVSSVNGLVAIWTEDGDYCVLAPAGGVEVGDLLSGELADPASCFVTVGRTGHVVFVRMHACRADAGRASALLEGR